MTSAAPRTSVHGRRAVRRPRRSTWRPGPIPERISFSRVTVFVGGLSVLVITISGWLSFLIAT